MVGGEANRAVAPTRGFEPALEAGVSRVRARRELLVDVLGQGFLITTVSAAEGKRTFTVTSRGVVGRRGER
jgi:hypothetical protein